MAFAIMVNIAASIMIGLLRSMNFKIQEEVFDEQAQAFDSVYAHDDEQFHTCHLGQTLNRRRVSFRPKI